jgi:dTDP-4-amino-4,6-dideoxygalactose transaminase
MFFFKGNIGSAMMEAFFVGPILTIFHYILNKFIKPIKQKNIRDVYYIYNIRHSERNQLKKFLKKNLIDVDIHYPTPLYKQPCFRGFFKNRFPISDEIHNTTLSLPISVAHKKNDILRVIKILNSY